MVLEFGERGDRLLPSARVAGRDASRIARSPATISAITQPCLRQRGSSVACWMRHSRGWSFKKPTALLAIDMHRKYSSEEYF